MGKFLKFFGAVCLVVCCVAAVGITHLLRKGAVLDNESRAYVETAIPAIMANWDQQALLERAGPALKSVATPSQVAVLFGKLSALGAVVSFETPRGTSLINYGTDSSETASYVTKAKFQNGDGLIKMGLVKTDGRWMINAFYVQSVGRLTAGRA